MGCFFSGGFAAKAMPVMPTRRMLTDCAASPAAPFNFACALKLVPPEAAEAAVAVILPFLAPVDAIATPAGAPIKFQSTAPPPARVAVVDADFPAPISVGAATAVTMGAALIARPAGRWPISGPAEFRTPERLGR